MSRRQTSVGSIFWGLILVAIGALLLARNFGYSIPIWNALTRYWPVLIIAWGLLKLADYYRFKKTGVSRPLFSGGEVFLLIVVIFAGSAITAAANMSPGFGEALNFSNNFDFWDIVGSNYQYTEHHELAVPAGSVLEIANMFGSVDVQGTDAGSIVLDVQKTVRAEDQSDADNRAKDFTFSISNAGGHYRIASNRDEPSSGSSFEIRIGNDRQRYKSNLTIKVPRNISITVNNKYGRVGLDSVTGTENIVNRYGSVVVHSITGPLQLENAYGSIDIDGVTGNLTASNGYGTTAIRNVGGRLEVQNKYGSVDVQDAKGGGTIDNRYSVISAHRIAGDWTMTGGNNSVDVDEADGRLSIDTTYKNVTVQNVKGSMTLKNHHGNVDIDMDASPVGIIDVNGDYSNVSLSLPSDSNFTIDGRTTSGQIDTEFESLNVARSGREQTISGTHGSGGPRITIETRSGKIRLDRRG